jgi:hypothetical protein
MSRTSREDLRKSLSDIQPDVTHNNFVYTVYSSIKQYVDVEQCKGQPKPSYNHPDSTSATKCQSTKSRNYKKPYWALHTYCGKC